MNPSLDNCPICGCALKTFYRMSSEEVVAYCSSVHAQNMTQAKHLYFEGTGDKTDDAKAMFHGEALKRGLLRNHERNTTKETRMGR